FYYVLNTVHMALDAEPDQLSMLVRRAGVVVIGSILTLGMYLVLRRLEGRSMRVMVTTAFLISIPASVLYAIVNFSAFYLVAPTSSLLQELTQMHAKHWSVASAIGDSAVSWYFFFVSWGILYVALSYAAKVGQAERRAAAYRSEAQTAQLRALRYQINPHFLFNTLNALSTLVLRQRTTEAESMISNLATFFRSSLTADPTADALLADEIAMQRLYLEIERVRFPERLLVAIDVPDSLESARIPGMILQPLVENAVKHGVARTSKPVTITIRAQAERGSLHLTVEDDADQVGGAADGAGVGLKNVRDRLAARFGDKAYVRFRRREEGGFRVDLLMPLLADG
ncbi:MAG: histidine kinase, partial [Alphaproteobacteria bacterium]|nr:histidine kinase [Alphaproteobacteria bacterium]